MKRVVITGLGAITPIGNNLEAYNEGLKNGVSGADIITRFDASLFKTKFACEVKNFNPDDFIDRKDARRMDLFTQFAMVCADEALADSKLLDFNNSILILEFSCNILNSMSFGTKQIEQSSIAIALQ